MPTEREVTDIILDKIILGPFNVISNFAVFDFDKTMIVNDCAEAVLHHMVRLGYPKAEENFLEYSSLLMKNAAGKEDVEAAYRFGATTIQGLSMSELETLVRTTMDYEGQEVGEEILLGKTIARGIKPREGVIKLIEHLQKLLDAVWVVSSSPIHIVRATIRYFNLPISDRKIIGISNLVGKNSVITNMLESPLPIYGGKVDCIKRFIHPAIPPRFAMGDSENDRAMIEYAVEKAVIDCGNSLTKSAEKNDWPILR